MKNQALEDYFANRQEVVTAKMPESKIDPLWGNARIAKAQSLYSSEELLHKIRDEYESRIKEIYGQCEYVIEFQRKGNQTTFDKCEKLSHIEWSFHRALDTVDKLHDRIRELEAEICELKSERL